MGLAKKRVNWERAADVLRLAALVTVAACLLMTGGARAGTMTLYSCHTPSGRAVSTAGWVASGVPGASNSCAAGGSLAVALPALPSTLNPTASWDFAAAPGTTVASMSATVCAHSYGQRAFAAVLRGDDVLAYASHIWSEWPPTLGCNGGAVSAAGAGAARISLRAWCDEGSSCPGSGTSADIALTSFRADITDRFAPVVSDVHESGSTVRFDATDTGVGVFRAVAEARVGQAGAWTELGHALIGSCSPLGETAYRYEFDTPQPCPLHTDAASLAVDEASLPVGTHDLRVVVEDAAGNRTDVLPSHAVVVSAPPVVAKVLVRRPALRLRSAAPFRLRGRILDLASKPIAGARILVESRPFLPKPGLATGQWRSVGHFSTATSGHFSVPLPAGPSRVLRVSYGGTSAESTVIVPAHITAHAHRRRVHNGHTLVISGRVTGPIPEGGVLTTLEVRQAGRWSTVATTRPWVRTGPSGTFTLKYHFRRTFRATTYKFRAAAGDDSAFQYTRGHSHVMSVRVVP